MYIHSYILWGLNFVGSPAHDIFAPRNLTHENYYDYGTSADVNECDKSPCHSNGVCTSTPGSYVPAIVATPKMEELVQVTIL